ncbi:MAG: hypothetical protein ACQET7_15035 [Thermodesulfobacteriota bacterium]
MPGKDESLLNLLTGLSWRISVLIAAVAYVLFRIVIPAIPIGDDQVRAIVRGASMAAA